MLADVLTNIQSLLQAWASRVIHTAGETHASLAMHQPILAAIEKGDPEAARAAMTLHMDRAVRRLRESMPPPVDDGHRVDPDGFQNVAHAGDQR